MDNVVLFKSRNGNVTQQDLYDALIKIGADKCDYLFIHSELNFGTPNPDLTKKGLLECLWETLKALNVKNLLVPTFTFSFCNHEDFDVQNSRSAMGVLTEYVRKLPEARRSIDPLMSVAMVGSDFSVIENIGNISVGEGCTYDLLHQKGNCKFLFLGNMMSSCMTYTHYMEVVKKVPYRYRKSFKGNVIDGDKVKEKEYFLDVRYGNVFPFNDNRIDELVLNNQAGKTINLGDSVLNIADEEKVYQYLGEAIEKDPDFMLCHKCPEQFDPTYIYEKKVAL